MAVGDDWQSIYAFSGSDITLFTQFEEKMGYAKLMKIVRTYRNSQEVIDIAGNFIQKNTSQIRKSLISPKHMEEPVIIYTYDSRAKDPKADRRSGAAYGVAYAVQTALEQIMKYEQQEEKKDKKYLRREFSYSKFQQTILLPENVEKDKISAKVEHGILSIEIPKMKEEEKQKTFKAIEVK